MRVTRVNSLSDLEQWPPGTLAIEDCMYLPLLHFLCMRFKIYGGSQIHTQNIILVPRIVNNEYMYTQ
jgi:hypothetical protein